MCGRYEGKMELPALGSTGLFSIAQLLQDKRRGQILVCSLMCFVDLAFEHGTE